jgi:WD40 repeat protein
MSGDHPNPQQAEFKYWAFISYSHADSAFADWLHKSMETYKVPKNLIGKPSRSGVVPERLFPIFRDREELPGSANLGDNLSRALQQSRYLIVICSPRSAASQWVNQEVKIFKSFGREDRVLCVIVDGEPNATEHPELGLQECFPEAVRFWVDAERRVTTIPTEPIAADARPGKDGKANALLKLLAGLLGVNFDDLKQRDHERRQRQMVALLGAAICLMGVMIYWIFAAEMSRREAQINEGKARASEQRAIEAKAEAEAKKKVAEAALDGEKRAKDEEAKAKVQAQESARLAKENEQAAKDQERKAKESEIQAIAARNDALTERKKAQESEKVAVTERQKAEEREQTIRRILSAADFSSAAKLVDESQEGRALAYLARALRFDPRNDSVAARLTTLLGYRNWALALMTPLAVNGKPVAVDFSPDGKLAAVAADKQVVTFTTATGQAFSTPLQHKGKVNGVQFSPNGEWLLTASEDGTARLWETATGKPVGEAMKHADWVHGASFSPDGKLIVTASQDRTARLWEAGTGKPVSEPMGHDSRVLWAGFSPDGKLVATAAGQSARLWDVTGKALGEPLKHEGGVVMVNFSPDSKRVVTASGDKSARIWNVSDSMPVGEPMKHNNWVDCAVFSPSGKTVATASSDRTARVWDAATGKPITPPILHDDAVRSVSFNPNATLLLTASADRTVRLWNSTTGENVAEALRHNGQVTAARFSPDGRFILTAANDGQTQIWTALKGEPLLEPLVHDAYVNAVALSSDGRWAATASDDRSVRLWEVLSGKLLFPGFEHTRRATCVQFSPDGKLLASGSDDNTVRLWDTAAGKAVGQPLTHDGRILSLSFSPDSTRLLTVSRGSGALLWDVATGKLVGKPLEHKAQVNSAQFSANGQFIVTSSEDKTARLWNVATSTPVDGLMTHEAEVTCATVNPDGTRVATGGRDRMVHLWAMPTAKLLASFRHEAAVNSVAFNQDGTLLASAADDKQVLVLDAQTGRPLTEPLKHEDKVVQAIFSPNGRFLLTISKERKAHLWDAATGKLLTDPLTQMGTIQGGAFSGDNRFVATCGEDKSARVRLIAIPTQPPTWLGELAEAVGGFRLSDAGGAEPVQDAQIRMSALRAQLAQTPEDGSYQTWGKWFLADRSTRTISPAATMTVREYVQRRVDEGGANNLTEALQMEPGNGLALAKLASLSKEGDQADFYSRLALSYDAGNPFVAWTRAQVLLAQSRFAEAYPVMEAALKIDPKAVKTFGPEGREITSRNRESGISKGWLPKGWDDASTATSVSVTYTRLTDGPQADVTALQMSVTSPTRGLAQLTGPRFIGKVGARLVVEGWVRSAKRQEITLAIRQFFSPFDKFAEQSLRTTEQWKPFKVNVAPGKDFAAELAFTLPPDYTVDIAGLTVREE